MKTTTDQSTGKVAKYNSWNTTVY